MGTLVQIDMENNRHLKKIKWSHSKRLLFGSLVILTKNKFSDVVIATILDRDNVLLSTGKVIFKYIFYILFIYKVELFTFLIVEIRGPVVLLIRSTIIL